MENAYGIGVKNRYELFYDEDVDPLEIIRQQEEEKEKRKTDKHCKDKSKISKSGKQISAVVPKKAPKEIPVANLPKPSDTLDKPRTRPFDRPSKNFRVFEDSKDAEDRKNFRNREDHQSMGSESRERDSEARRGRGGFRGRGRPRGRGSFFTAFEGRPRREFDRYSGSDKVGTRPVDKRDGPGSNNWVDTKSDMSRRDADSWMNEEFNETVDKNTDSSWREAFEENEIQSSNREEIVAEKNTEDSVTENMDSKENEPVPEERTEEGVKEMTLDEWKREQEAKRSVPKYNLRKPGEGEDGNQWKKLYMLKKKVREDDEDEEEEEDDEDVDDEEFARRGRQRQLVDIQINFNDSRRGRGRGRGVRGIGPRSGGVVGNKEVARSERRDDGTGSNVVGRSYGRGSSKSSKSGQQSAPRVDDWNDFPSLVTV